MNCLVNPTHLSQPPWETFGEGSVLVEDGIDEVIENEKIEASRIYVGADESGLLQSTNCVAEAAQATSSIWIKRSGSDAAQGLIMLEDENVEVGYRSFVAAPDWLKYTFSKHFSGMAHGSLRYKIIISLGAEILVYLPTLEVHYMLKGV